MVHLRSACTERDSDTQLRCTAPTMQPGIPSAFVRAQRRCATKRCAQPQIYLIDSRQASYRCVATLCRQGFVCIYGESFSASTTRVDNISCVSGFQFVFETRFWRCRLCDLKQHRCLLQAHLIRPRSLHLSQWRTPQAMVAWSSLPKKVLVELKC